MRYFETMGHVATDRALIDLRDERDNLSIQLNILQDSEQADPAALGTLKRNLGILDRRIANHTTTTDA
jgi:hypothetical protein